MLSGDGLFMRFRRSTTASVAVRIAIGAFMLGLFAIGVLAAWMVTAQPAASTEPERYGQDELDQLLAPIALYPDQLLSQVLMAATYPLEVVQAARFVEQNPGLRGDALDNALAARNWDPSVQSLAAFPQVLAMMNDKLDWTQRLGDAFLGDEPRVMDTVQSLRRRAEAAGNLQSTPQQAVTDVDREIFIEPVQPDVIYVPVYDPLVVYGPWWAPAFPPWFWYPPPIYGYPAWPFFGVGIVFGGGWQVSHHHWGWSHADWGHHRIAIDPGNNRFWNHPGRPSPPPPGGSWQHSPEHRRGVAYPNPVTRDRFVAVDPGAVRARENFRGRDLVPPAGAVARQVAPPGAGGRLGPDARPPVTSSQASSRPVPTTPAQPIPGASYTPTQPSRGIAPAPASMAAQPPRPVARPAAPVFDPGLSRQQAQINAQRGLESRRSIPATPPSMNRAPAPPAMNRAPAPPAHGNAPSASRPR